MRRVAAILAYAGGAALAAACFLPIYRFEVEPEVSLTLLDPPDGAPDSALVFALEPLAAAVVAGVLGTLVLVRPRPGLALGLAVAGLLGTAFFLTYAVWIAFDGDPATVLALGLLPGLAGGLLLLAAAGAAWLGSPDEEAPAPTGPPPAGWYPDPAGGGGLRHWDGTRWGEARSLEPG